MEKSVLDTDTARALGIEDLLQSGTLQSREIAPPKAVGKLDSEVSETPAKKFDQSGWMKSAAVMMLAEIPDEQIAEELGKPLSIILSLSGLPEFRRIVDNLSKGNEEQVAEKLLSSGLTRSILTVFAIQNNDKNRPETRLKAALAVIEHKLGKPVDKSRHQKDTPASEKILSNVTEGMTAEENLDNLIKREMELHPELKHQFKITQ